MYEGFWSQIGACHNILGGGALILTCRAGSFALRHSYEAVYNLKTFPPRKKFTEQKQMVTLQDYDTDFLENKEQTKVYLPEKSTMYGKFFQAAETCNKQCVFGWIVHNNSETCVTT